MRVIGYWLGECAIRLEIVKTTHSDEQIRDFIHSMYKKIREKMSNHSPFSPLWIEDVIDVVPGWHTLTLHTRPWGSIAMQPIEIKDAWLQEVLSFLAMEEAHVDHPHVIKNIEVCYGPHCALDLTDLSLFCGLTKEEIITIHMRTVYTVRMIGFSPGFVYLDGLDSRIQMPRLDHPRVQVPTGSVGIAGMQTGVYSLSTPGGWRILGRVHQPLFSLSNDPMTFLSIGDRVSFIYVHCNSCRAHNIYEEEI